MSPFSKNIGMLVVAVSRPSDRQRKISVGLWDTLAGVDECNGSPSKLGRIGTWHEWILSSRPEFNK